MARLPRQTDRFYGLVEEFQAAVAEERLRREMALAEMDEMRLRVLRWAVSHGYPYADLEEAVG